MTHRYPFHSRYFMAIGRAAKRLKQEQGTKQRSVWVWDREFWAIDGELRSCVAEWF